MNVGLLEISSALVLETGMAALTVLPKERNAALKTSTSFATEYMALECEFKYSLHSTILSH